MALAGSNGFVIDSVWTNAQRIVPGQLFDGDARIATTKKQMIGK